MSHTPYANVELSRLVQQRSLEVLLNNPMGKLKWRLNKSGDVTCIVEYFDALALILVGRLDQPDVVCAVLLGHYIWDSLPSFALLAAFDVVEVLQELLELVSIELRSDDVAERTCLEYLVILFNVLHITLIERFQVADQIRLLSDFSVTLKMIHHKFLGARAIRGPVQSASMLCPLNLLEHLNNSH